MPLKIDAIDSQFAVSTGTNVNSSAGMSRFDDPPTDAHKLKIEAQKDDDTPDVFSPGDTYKVSFKTDDGDFKIDEATVTRTDALGDGPESPHAVIFEGLDKDGELVQVVWTPEFDIDAWYYDNFQGGQPPEFYNSEVNTGAAPQAVCFEASMRIDTPSGSQEVKSIRAGDYVMTHDAGPQQVKWGAHRRLRAWGRHAPVVFEDGVIGNSGPLVLSQQHRILIHAPEVRSAFNSRSVLVPAVAFTNGETVRIRPRNEIVYVHLLLEEHHVLTAQGVACESLLLGAVSKHLLRQLRQDASDDQVAGETSDVARAFEQPGDALQWMSERPARPCLSVREGMRLIAKIRGHAFTKPKTLVGPGRRRHSPYRVKLENGLDQWTAASSDLPAYRAIRRRHLRAVS